MEITEVRIKLVDNPTERLRAFCSITMDGDFVIRDLKIIDGVNGPFVAMPSRKLADRCPRCGSKNHLRAKFCSECGAKLNENRAPKDATGRAKLHADVAHPINAGCRERIQTAVVTAYRAETERAKSPDYRPPVYEEFEDDGSMDFLHEPASHAAAPHPTPHAAPQPAPAVHASVASVPHKKAEEASDSDFSDYNSLIADLKREAATRREQPSDRRQQSYRPPTTERRTDPPTQTRPEPERVAQRQQQRSEPPTREPQTGTRPSFPPADRPEVVKVSTTSPSSTAASDNGLAAAAAPRAVESQSKRQEQTDDDFGAGLV